MQRTGTRLERLAGSGPCLPSSFVRFPLLRSCFARLVSPLFASLRLISSHSTAYPTSLPSIPLVNQFPDQQALAFDNYNTKLLFFMSMMIIQHHDDGGHDDKYRKNMPFVLYNTSPLTPFAVSATFILLQSVFFVLVSRSTTNLCGICLMTYISYFFFGLCVARSSNHVSHSDTIGLEVSGSWWACLNC